MPDPTAQQEYINTLTEFTDNRDILEYVGRATFANEYYIDIANVIDVHTSNPLNDGITSLNNALESGGIGVYAVTHAALLNVQEAVASERRQPGTGIPLLTDVLDPNDPRGVDGEVRNVMTNQFGNMLLQEPANAAANTPARGIVATENEAFVQGFTFAVTNTEQLRAITSTDTSWDRNQDNQVDISERQDALAVARAAIQNLTDTQKIQIGPISMSINEARALTDRSLDGVNDPDISQQQALVAGTVMALAGMREENTPRYAGVLLEDVPEMAAATSLPTVPPTVTAGNAGVSGGGTPNR